MRIWQNSKAAQGALDSFSRLDPLQPGLLVGCQAESFGVRGFRIITLSPPRRWGIGYLFQINGDVNDYTLVYESPAMITRQAVKFELEDIDLP